MRNLSFVQSVMSCFISGIFKNTTGDISDKYYIEITPASWTFTIWAFIYIWQISWIVYALVNLFRRTEDGPGYAHPPIVTVPFCLAYLCNMCFNAGWMIIWDRQILEAAFAFLFLIALTLYICLVIVYRSFDANANILIKQNRKADIWLVRMLIFNGIGIYATWTTIATLLNLAIVITYRSNPAISQDVASTVSLCVLTLEIAVFVSTDLTILDRYTRYTFTPYLVLIVALSGVTAKNWQDGARNSIWGVALLIAAVVAAVTKFAMLFYRHFQKPLYVKEENEKGTVSTDL